MSNEMPAAFARSDYEARDFQAEDIGRAGRRRIESAALQNIRPVDPRRGGLDQHFARAGPRHGPLDNRQFSRTVSDYRLHRGGKGRHSPAY
jgi:hypothetical protein